MTPLDISLADLITRLDGEFSDSDDLARISEAQLRARTLTDLGDQLVGHYVGRAKQAGASWSEIGDAVGVSKQAAQQRHAPAPFERFTRLNRHVIVLAQEAARAHKNDAIGTEHLLLGLLGEQAGLAYDVLLTEVDSEQAIRDAVTAVLPLAGKRAPRGHIAFRPEAKTVIEAALSVAVELGHDWVGTEHLLLGLIRVEQSAAAQVLRELGFTSESLHAAVRAELGKRVTSSDGGA